ncbi:MAG: transposase [Paludibacterium sp.]|uniref:IS66 family insertion sequence element accessory protein TnpA n=1 Tax=Paludibacterium sp. TaxID=1917523 RepID=UPI0025CE7E37|nr:IS66 family insertion sequence element accessory protein TnpB [Paludibacterium sp.]MBV8049290.1 transposase [Paludibacterium sp.]
MEQRPKRRLNRSINEWQSLLSQFKSSGMTGAAFCRSHGITESVFYRWRALLAARELPAGEPTSPAFVDLGPLKSEPQREPRFELRLDLGAGLTLTLVRG